MRYIHHYESFNNDIFSEALDVFQDVIDEFNMVKINLLPTDVLLFTSTYPENRISFFVLNRGEKHITFRIILKGVHNRVTHMMRTTRKDIEQYIIDNISGRCRSIGLMLGISYMDGSNFLLGLEITITQING